MRYYDSISWAGHEDNTRATCVIYVCITVGVTAVLTVIVFKTIPKGRHGGSRSENTKRPRHPFTCKMSSRPIELASAKKGMM